MKSPEKGNPEDERVARKLIDSLGLEDTSAGRYMEGNPPPRPEELRENVSEEESARQVSIGAFLEAVDGLTVDASESSSPLATRSVEVKLLDGRFVSIWRVPDENVDKLKEQAMAGMNIREAEEPGTWTQTSYLLYKDGQMEKAFDSHNRSDMQSATVGTSGHEGAQATREAIREAIDRISRKLVTEKEERELGLRSATEADMQDAKEIFLLIEEAKKGNE